MKHTPRGVLLPTLILALALTLALGCSCTYALFVLQQDVEANPIPIADYAIAVTDADGLWAETYTAPLAAWDLHTFTLTAEGTASTGYCQVLVDDRAYTTCQLSPEESLSLTVQAAEGSEITFLSNWGEAESRPAALTLAGEPTVYGDEDVIRHDRTDFTVYTVPFGASMEGIARHYGVEAEDIRLYNGLPDYAPCSEGQLLEIPYVKEGAAEDYVPTGGLTVILEAEGAQLPEEATLLWQGHELQFDDGVCMLERLPAGDHELEVVLPELEGYTLEGELECTAAIAEDEWTEVTFRVEYVRDHGEVAVWPELEGDVLPGGLTLLLEGPEDTYELTLEEMLEEEPLVLPTGGYTAWIEGGAPEGYVLETGLSDEEFILSTEGLELTLYVTVTALPPPETPVTE